MADILDIRPDRLDSDQKLLRKILAAINLWQGGIVPGQSSNITIDSSGGAGSVTVTPNPGGAATSDQVGGYTYIGYFRPDVSLTAYSDGDVVGSSRLVAAFRQGVGSGVLQNVTVHAREAAFTAADLDILLFRAPLSSSTLTDNAAPTFTDADFAGLQGIVSIPADSWVQYGTGYAAASVANLGIALKSSNAGTVGIDHLVWPVVIARGAVTFTDADSLNMWFGFLQD